MALFYAMEIVFATNNIHKLKEVSAILGKKHRILGLTDLDINEEIPENHNTLEENASQKAWFIYRSTGRNCFADDTGLEVNALDGEPGVYSARYSRVGDPVFPEMNIVKGNIRKLLMKMEGIADRRAQFRTVISLIINGIEYKFEGMIKGEITMKPSGSEGFGYDPVFKPEGHDGTFAEMDLETKNRISHRALATAGLAQFLNKM